MKADVLIAGAGHGGLVAAAKLAKSGFNVKILEKTVLENLSWDWEDIFDVDVFKRIGMKPVDPSLYTFPKNLCMMSSNEAHEIHPNIKMGFEASMDRRVLIKMLVNHALDAGVEISFDTQVTGPLLKNNLIKGLKIKGGEITSDLIIDSAGINSPVRQNLPSDYKIIKSFKRGERFFTYRGYFNKTKDDSQWRICIGYRGKRGIMWINSCEEYSDVLIGCMDPFRKGELDILLKDLQTRYPVIGKDVKRGGQIALIPVRRTIPRLIGPNYAVIGDAACMTIPINGSGIANSMTAGDILAKTIVKAAENPHVKENPEIKYDNVDLWQYQYDYFREIGADMAFIDLFKNFLMIVDFNDLNFVFKNITRLGNQIDLDAIREDGSIEFLKLMNSGTIRLLANVITLLLSSLTRPLLLLKVLNVVITGLLARQSCMSIPKKYDEKKVSRWIAKGERFYRPYTKKIIK